MEFLKNFDAETKNFLKLAVPGYEHYFSHQTGRLRKQTSELTNLAYMIAGNGIVKGGIYSLTFHVPNLVMEQCMDMYSLSPNLKLGITAAYMIGNAVIGNAAYLTGIARGCRTMPEKTKAEILDFIKGSQPQSPQDSIEHAVSD